MLIVLTVALACMLCCVTLHYRVFGLLNSRISPVQARQHWRVLLGVVITFGTHLLEISIFAAAMAFLHQLPADWDVGELVGARVGYVPDYLYCSAMAYTTLGFEQITPTGSIRLLIGIEALVGVVLVAWSASFTYLLMGRFWSDHPGRK